MMRSGVSPLATHPRRTHSKSDAHRPVVALPLRLEPALATLASRPPAGDWIYEIKFDGYRMLVRVHGGDVRLITRNGHDWTARLSHLHAEYERLRLPDGWYDGEIVVPGAGGVPDFHALQSAFSGRREQIVHYLFDAPFLAGNDHRRMPVEERRAKLLAALPESEVVRFSHEFLAPADHLVASACKMGLEGIVGKRRGSPYTSGRCSDWIKLKCISRREFVIGGYTPAGAARAEVGALLVGYFDERMQLQYAGRIGTGFTGAVLIDLGGRLQSLARATRPFATSTGHDQRARWVEPQLVCEVAYVEWPQGGRLRHASFKALRPGQEASAVRASTAAVDDELQGEEPPDLRNKERLRSLDKSMTYARVHDAGRPKALAARNARATAENKTETVGSVKSMGYEEKVHPPRRPGTPLRPVAGVIDASTGLTWTDLEQYYIKIAAWALPHLKARPAYIRRAPDGLQGNTTFQQHPDRTGLKGTPPELWPGHEPAFLFDTAEDLVEAVQAGVVEIHTWNSTAQAIHLPDRVIFDLDPGQGVNWSQVREAALFTRAALDELGLRSWVKTTGGAGLHVVVPLLREHGYPVVHAFARALAAHMAAVLPQRLVVKPGARNRVGRIFVDYLRNGQSQSTAAAFSARARPGMGVSMPISWDELATTLAGDQWTIASALDYVRERAGDPWSGYWETEQSLAVAVDRLKVSAA